MSTLEALLRAVEEAFGVDPRGRLTSSARDAPLFALVRCQEGLAWRFHARVDDERVIRVARLVGRERLPVATTFAAVPSLERRLPIMEALDATVDERFRWWRLRDASGQERFEYRSVDAAEGGEALAADLWIIR